MGILKEDLSQIFYWIISIPSKIVGGVSKSYESLQAELKDMTDQKERYKTLAHENETAQRAFTWDCVSLWFHWCDCLTCIPYKPFWLCNYVCNLFFDCSLLTSMFHT